MRQYQRRKSNRLVVIIPIVLQFLLVGGFIAFIILSEETLKQNESTNHPYANHCYSNVELSTAGKKVFESKDKMYLIPIYQKAAAKYKIPWEYLAGINYVESTLWTNQNASGVGAIGPMQFMERTWVGWSDQFAQDYPGARTQYWGLGDINDEYLDVIKRPEMIKRYGGLGIDGDGDGIADPKSEVDAIFAAANYLSKNGMADGKIDKAIFTYNHSYEYVNMVKKRANEFTQPVSGSSNQLSTSRCDEDNNGDNHMQMVGGDWIWPLNRVEGIYISSPFSYGTCVGGRCNHGGVDFAGVNITGTTVRATADGTAYGLVQSNGVELTGCGYYTMIDHRNGVQTYYCHLVEPSPIPSSGKMVKKGDPVGKVGSTGNSSGPHLHYQVKVNGRIVNPLQYLTLPSGVK